MSVKRLEAIDGLRGILALSVLLSHLVGASMGWYQTRPFVGAYISVIYFFMMSGFVLSYSYRAESVWKYFLKRLARLWPLMFFSTVLMMILYKYNQLIGGYVSSPEIFLPGTFLKNILFLHGIYWNNFPLINEPSWSISLEFWISLLIPIIFIRINLICKLIISVIIFSIILFNNRMALPLGFSTACLSMLIGSICFDLTKKKWFIDNLNEYFFDLFVLFSLLVCAVGIYEQNHNILDYFYIIAFIPLIFVDFLSEKSVVKQILCSRFCLFLGYISFPLYLLHSSVIISNFLYRKDHVLLAIMTGACVSIFIAYGYARYIDFYLYRYLKNVINRL